MIKESTTRDLAAARRELRRQIDVLERAGNGAARGAEGGPRLLSLGELEAVRDSLVVGRTSIDHGCGRRRSTFEAMVADPRAHKWRRISRAELGLPGCGEYRVVPRLGLVGVLAGWWRVVLSSGCP